MGDITGTNEWVETIHYVELPDSLSGGEAGIANIARIQLANRTAYLRSITNAHAADTDAHEASSEVVPNRIIQRDDAGCAKVPSPSDSLDMANREYTLAQTSGLLRTAKNLSDLQSASSARYELSLDSKVETNAKINVLLAKANNLTDLTDKALARNNLDVYSRGEVVSMTELYKAHKVHGHSYTSLDLPGKFSSPIYYIGSKTVIDRNGKVDWNDLINIPKPLQNYGVYCAH